MGWLRRLQVHGVAQRVVFNIYSVQKYAHAPFVEAELVLLSSGLKVS